MFTLQAISVKFHRYMGDFVTLQEAAERLGVHYMTVYRYVRMGQLPAHKEGGAWRVATGDLDLFQHVEGAEPSVYLARRGAPWHQRFENRVLEGDRSGAWRVVEAALAGGVEPIDVYRQIFTPVLESVGSRWESGDLDVGLEHAVTTMISQFIGRLGPRFTRRGRRKGTVVVAGPPGERHTLGLSMVADVLRSGGYAAVDLGGDLPVEAMAPVFARIQDLKALCLGVLNPDALDECRRVVTAARRHLDRSVPIVVGGRAIRGSVDAHRLGADHFSTLESVLDAVETGRDLRPAVSV